MSVIIQRFVLGWAVVRFGQTIPKNNSASSEYKTNFGTNNCCKFYLRCLRVRIWSYSGPYSVQMQENTDQNNYEYGQFLRRRVNI